MKVEYYTGPTPPEQPKKKSTVKSIILKLLTSIDNFIIKLVNFAIFVLTIYVIFAKFQVFKTTSINDLSPEIIFNSNPEVITNWKNWRNILYLVLVIDIIPITLVSTLSKLWHYSNNYQKLVKSWVSLVIFLTFSYAIASFIIDVFYLFSRLFSVYTS